MTVVFMLIEVETGKIHEVLEKLKGAEGIDEIYAITVTQHYEWDWSMWEWYWTFPIPIGLYIHYWEKDRPTDWQE